MIYEQLLAFDSLSEIAEPLDPHLQRILDENPDLDVDRMPLVKRLHPRRRSPDVAPGHTTVPAYDAYLKTSICLSCGKPVAECNGTRNKPR